MKTKKKIEELAWHIRWNKSFIMGKIKNENNNKKNKNLPGT
jgi:hypothetical protein